MMAQGRRWANSQTEQVRSENWPNGWCAFGGVPNQVNSQPSLPETRLWWVPPSQVSLARDVQAGPAGEEDFGLGSL